jgi:hypothetical protein
MQLGRRTAQVAPPLQAGSPPAQLQGRCTSGGPQRVGGGGRSRPRRQQFGPLEWSNTGKQFGAGSVKLQQDGSAGGAKAAALGFRACAVWARCCS